MKKFAKFIKIYYTIQFYENGFYNYREKSVALNAPSGDYLCIESDNQTYDVTSISSVYVEKIPPNVSTDVDPSSDIEAIDDPTNHRFVYSIPVDRVTRIETTQQSQSN